MLAIAALLSILLYAHAAVAIDLDNIASFVWISLAAGAIYFCAVLAVLKRSPKRGDLALILLTAAALRGLALTPEPNLSTDAFRYVWDGRVQAAGFSPYLHVPADPQLAHLRDDAIYPRINQKEHAVTIYPPAAQMAFRAAHAISDDLTGVRIVMALCDFVALGGVMVLLATLGLPRERVIIYAWHPLPIWEFVAQSHIDAAATAAIVWGLVAVARGRQGLTGAIFAIAALIKYFPVVLLPALWRRFDWRLPAAFGAVAAILYMPFLRDAGGSVFGFLGRHLDNEGYGAGWGFHPVWLLRDFALADPGAQAYVAVALGLLALLAVVALFRRDASEIGWGTALLLGGAFVFLTSPHYPWYFAFLVPLLAVVPRAWGFWMTICAVVLYLPRPPGGVTWTELYLTVYWVPVAILAGGSAWHRFVSPASSLGGPTHAPAPAGRSRSWGNGS